MKQKIQIEGLQVLLLTTLDKSEKGMSSNETEPESQSRTPRYDLPSCLCDIGTGQYFKMFHQQKYDNETNNSELSEPVSENDVIALSKKTVRADAINPQWSCELSI